MPMIKKIELDILKPHLPNVLDFASTIAGIDPGYKVCLDVTEMDEKTETLVLVVEAESLDYERIETAIHSMGGSVHSIDKCLVVGDTSNED